MTRRRCLLIWLIAICAAFFALDCLSIHSGDDLGYMFADSAHHSADGPRVTSVRQCFTTQASHYCTTNGRFLVHVVVMLVLNFLPLWAFRILNALMFCLLWLLAVRLVNPDARRLTATRALTLMAMFCLFPPPGMVLPTLVAYAVNYLWVSVACLGLVLAIRRRVSPSVLLPVAFTVGTLHEGWSLPMCAALLVALLQRRIRWPLFLAFVAGTAVVVFAPGNFSHAGQGGGFALAAIARKASALGTDLLRTAIFPAAVAALVWGAVRPRSCRAFMAAHLPALAAIATAVAFAMLTFTSPRQLTCPIIITLLLVLKAIQPLLTPGACKWAIFGAIAVTAAFMTLTGAAKWHVKARYDSLLASVNSGRPVASASYAMPAWIPADNSAFWRAVAPDPLSNRGLAAVGDRYTRQGLSRLRRYRNPDAPKLRTILPYAPARIVATRTAAPFHVFAFPKGRKPLDMPPVLEAFTVADSTYCLSSSFISPHL